MKSAQVTSQRALELCAYHAPDKFTLPILDLLSCGPLVVHREEIVCATYEEARLGDQFAEEVENLRQKGLVWVIVHHDIEQQRFGITPLGKLVRRLLKCHTTITNAYPPHLITEPYPPAQDAFSRAKDRASAAGFCARTVADIYDQTYGVKDWEREMRHRYVQWQRNPWK